MAIGILASDIRSLNIHDTDIEMVDHIKTFGIINIDNRLNFKAHVSEICIKAGRQLNILQTLKIPKYLQSIGNLRIVHFIYFRLLPSRLDILWQN